MTDRLTLAHVIEDAGIEREKAERMASAIFDAIHDNVATKQDIEAVRADIAKLELATKADIAAVRADMREMGGRLHREIDRVVIRLGAAMVVLLGLLFTALHYWPPHG